ncbi:MAG TPA: GIY-YIG nuclease family protein [Candidatus Saccharimonadales bacterium]|jgi:predicted GIY-YIG superfamily endonuclease|nr:GIY-YIG nuclease family protein [Candidatus Saccharimonadales bacterium]
MEEFSWTSHSNHDRLWPRKTKEVFMPWYVYLLRLHNGCIYVGCTNDLERRLAEHRSGSGSHITSESVTVERIHCETFPDRASALKREQQLKGWSRAKKFALATGRLKDLKRLSKAHNDGASASPCKRSRMNRIAD